ncbi:MAG: SpoIIE family protein phosphatase [Phycisphaerales bacterium]
MPGPRNAPTIILAASEAARAAADAAAQAMLEAWHAADRPTLDRRSISVAIDALSSGASSGAVVVAALTPDDPSMFAYQLADLAHHVLAPVVLLLQEDDPRLTRLASDDRLVVERVNAEASYLAAVVRTLARCQPVIRRLDQDLRLTMSSLRGAETEMERMQEELQLAATVQREFIPDHPPKIPGLNLAVVFRPAGYVSGDIFEITPLDDEHVGFFLGDAVGHGVPAALLTLVIAKSLRKLDRLEGSFTIVPPAEALRRLNVELTDRPGAGHRFATAIYGVINTRTRQVRLAGAGHPPPILLRNGNVERVQTEGPLLGVFPEAEFSEARLTLGARDSLILYSDGFETVYHEPGVDNAALKLPTQLHIERLTGLGEKSWDPKAVAASVARFERELDEQAGSLHQGDDLTAMLIAPCPTAAAVAA